jgi:hypothetical protein
MRESEIFLRTPSNSSALEPDPENKQDSNHIEEVSFLMTLQVTIYWFNFKFYHQKIKK